ncbi:hypothetical protein [Saccharibacillus deserti]|uniref:hypothetical protein n=1 Tax=Saccharibacillus deserti TaxID=1634444 RepID=UPI001552B6F5|nr:hypothetical protein [Saccharibacillus deserti]
MNEGGLSGIELFAFDLAEEAGAKEPRRIVRRYGLLKLSCGETAGCGACLLSEGFAPADPVRWSACLRRLRGLAPEEAAAAIAADRWGARERHPAQYALAARTLADLLAAREARRSGARLLLGLGAAGMLGGLAARASAQGSDAPGGPAADSRAQGGGRSQHAAVRLTPEALVRAARTSAVIGRPASSDLMDRADSYCSWF